MARWRAYSNSLSLNHTNQKVIGGKVASQFRYKLWQINLENPWWRGGEHIQTGSLWRIWIQNSLVARWRAIPDTSFEISFMKNHLWWGGEHNQTDYLWWIWIRNSLVARWQAINDTSFEKIYLKIICSGVASIFKQSLFESYESKSQWWPGGEPVLIQALTNQSWKSLVARWRAYPSMLSLKNMNSNFPGGEVASHFWH